MNKRGILIAAFTLSLCGSFFAWTPNSQGSSANTGSPKSESVGQSDQNSDQSGNTLNRRDVRNPSLVYAATGVGNTSQMNIMPAASGEDDQDSDDQNQGTAEDKEIPMGAGLPPYVTGVPPRNPIVPGVKPATETEGDQNQDQNKDKTVTPVEGTDAVSQETGTDPNKETNDKTKNKTAEVKETTGTKESGKSIDTKRSSVKKLPAVFYSR